LPVLVDGRDVVEVTNGVVLVADCVVLDGGFCVDVVSTVVLDFIVVSSTDVVVAASVVVRTAKIDVVVSDVNSRFVVASADVVFTSSVVKFCTDVVVFTTRVVVVVADGVFVVGGFGVDVVSTVVTAIAVISWTDVVVVGASDIVATS